MSGEDAASFLQGQFSNDLRLLATQPAVYGLWLTVKGKVLADSFILRAETADQFWIGSYHCAAEVIRERLESHVIADDVAIEDQTAEWAGVSIVGGSTGGVGETPEGVLAFPGRRTRPSNTEWVFRTQSEPELRQRLASFPQLSDRELEQLRIAAAIPSVPADMGPSDLPNEGALETEALSYTKGCYLGQEVMARLKSLGQVRRRLLQVRGVGDLPSLPAPVFAGSRQVGELRSAISTADNGFSGLAMLSLLHVSSASELSLAADCAPTLRVTQAS